MNYTAKTERLPAKEFLVIPGAIVLGDESAEDATDSIGDSMRILSGRIKDGSIERLKEAARSKAVYTLFCRSCEKAEGRNQWVCGYDVACETNGGAVPDGFELVRLEPSEYAVFDCDCDGEMTRKQVYEEINRLYWGEWLPRNPYISMIEEETGANDPAIASIELATPLDPAVEKFRVTMWFPIQKKMTHIRADDGRIITSPSELEPLLKGAFPAFVKTLGHIRFFYVANEIWDGKSSLAFKTGDETLAVVTLDNGAFYISIAGENFRIADETLLDTVYNALDKNAAPGQRRPAEQLTVNLTAPNEIPCGYRCDLCLGSKNSDPNNYSPGKNFGYLNWLCYNGCVPGIDVERFDGVWNCPGCAETRRTRVCRLSPCQKAMEETDCAECGEHHSCDVYQNCLYPGQCNLGLTAGEITSLIIPYCSRERLDFYANGGQTNAISDKNV